MAACICIGSRGKRVEQTSEHAALMDRTYRHQRRIYDLTRAYYLLGRDRLLADLAPPAGERVLEIACGTGRNLAHVAQRYPQTKLYGVDISNEMLDSAQAKLGRRAALAQADACDFDGRALFGVDGFDRVILSYSLSMIPDWTRALDVAVSQLAPRGEVHIVDFGRQHALPRWFRNGLNEWLTRFHVTPRTELAQVAVSIARKHNYTAQTRDLFGSYAQICVLRP
jgi:S-adenosylmethionine-diacylgycerolhomoserine-N-methlytransferase